MSIYGIEFSQFNVGGLPRITDIIVGTRSNNNYQFNAQGFCDTAGNPIVLFAAGVGTNVNQITFTNAPTGFAPSIAPTGSDTDINLNLQGYGATGVVVFPATTHVVLPAGTAAQAITGQAGGIRYNTTSQYLDYWSTLSNSWVDITTGSVISTLTYVTNTNETAVLPNSQNLSALSTGIVKVTTTTGILSSLAIPLVVADGGTGDSSFTAYMPICGGTTTTGALQSVGTGSAGQVLTYVSSSALPTWQNSIPKSWVNQTTTPVTLVANTSYLANDSSGVITFNMPATVAQFAEFQIAGWQQGWEIQLNTGQTAYDNNVNTTSGGTISSFSSIYNCVTIVCTVANTSFLVISSNGTLAYA